MALLSLESPPPVVKNGSKWQLVAVSLSEHFWERAERLTSLRREERDEMQRYVALTSGHMEFLLQALDGEPAVVRNPDLPLLPVTADPVLVREAEIFLRRTSLPFELRKKWPTGGLPQYGVKGLIPAEHQGHPGRALCIWGDAGWGGLVSQGKYQDGRFSDELVKACVTLLREWQPQPAPVWVTCIPSRRHPNLVFDFSQRLAKALDLPFCPVLIKTDDRPEQKSMANSAQQARNVDGSLKIDSSSMPEGPVLLVDDMVDSRWTLTVAAWLLRSQGSGEIWPLALAITGKGT